MVVGRRTVAAFQLFLEQAQLGRLKYGAVNLPYR